MKNIIIKTLSAILANIIIISNVTILATKEKDLALYDAATTGNVQEVRRLLEAGYPVTERTSRGDTPLMVAAYRGNLDCLNVLLAANADIEARNQQQSTPLSLAVNNGHTNCAQALINARANTKIKDTLGYTLLHIAAEQNHSACLKLLIDSQASPNIPSNNGTTPIHTAAGEGFNECIKLLMSAHAHVDRQDNNGCNPLHCAISRNHTSVVEQLLKAGAKTDIKNKHNLTPLMCSIYGKNNDITRLLLAAGADVNKVDCKGITPLLLASQLGHAECVRILVENGALIKEVPILHYNALHEVAHKGDAVILNHLMKARNVNINARMLSLDTPLTIAAYNGHHECVKILIEAGAALDVCDDQKSSVMQKAAFGGNLACIELLIAAGAPVNIANKGTVTPLLESVFRKDSECVRALIAAGANILYTSPRGWNTFKTARYNGDTKTVGVLREALYAKVLTANPIEQQSLLPCFVEECSVENILSFIDTIGHDRIHEIMVYACSTGRHDVVSALLAKGADPLKQTADGKRLWYIAQEKGHHTIVQLFGQYIEASSSQLLQQEATQKEELYQKTAKKHSQNAGARKKRAAAEKVSYEHNDDDGELPPVSVTDEEYLAWYKVNRGIQDLSLEDKPAASAAQTTGGGRKKRVLSIAACSYAPRVAEWITAPQRALNRPAYANAPEVAESYIILQHRAGECIDAHADNYCIKEELADGTITARVLCFIFQGKRKETVVLEYALDKESKVIFHRYFNKASKHIDLLRRFNVVPGVQPSSINIESMPIQQNARQNPSFVVQEHEHYLEVYDQRDQVTIIVFKPIVFKPKE